MVETLASDSDHSSLHFSVLHMVVARVRGRFARWACTIQMDGQAPARSSVTARVEAASIDTGVADRDAHLRSADFLDAERFPAIVFKSKRVETTDRRRFHVVGDLTLRDVTRELALEVQYAGSVKDPRGDLRSGFSASASLDRRDFGLTWNEVLEAGGVLVGDRIDIQIEVEAIRTATSGQAA